MRANAEKCHLLVAGNYEVSSNISEFEMTLKVVKKKNY